MTDTTLPVGNHYGAVDSILSKLPATGPYGVPVSSVPEVGSQPYVQDLQRLQLANQARSSSATLSPEELEALKWANWSASNGFNTAGEMAQRQMVDQYYNNILPYVASGTGEDVVKYQGMFHAKHPNEARLLGGVSEPRGRYMEALGFGLSEEEARQYALTNDLSNKDATLQQQMDERRAAIEGQRKLLGNEFSLTPNQINQYVITGKYDDKADNKSADRKLKLRKERDSLFRSFDLAEEQTNDALRSVDNILGVLQATDDQGNLVPSDRSLTDLELPASGKMAEIISKNLPYTTDADKLRAYLETLKASSVFSSLQQLRDAAADGSSGLGQVTNIEINLLANRIAALNPRMLNDDDLAREVHYFASRLKKVQSDIRERRKLEEEFYNGELGDDPTPPVSRAPSTAVPANPAPAQINKPNDPLGIRR